MPNLRIILRRTKSAIDLTKVVLRREMRGNNNSIQAVATVPSPASTGQTPRRRDIMPLVEWGFARLKYVRVKASTLCLAINCQGHYADVIQEELVKLNE